MHMLNIEIKKCDFLSTLLSLSVLLLFFCNNVNAENLKCEILLNPKKYEKMVLKAYQEAWKYSDNYYKSGDCQCNVVKLYEQMKYSFPKIQASDFSVLIITHPYSVDLELMGPTVHVLKSREQITNGDFEHKDYFYHVVLKFRDWILDLDSDIKPKAYPIQIYIEEMLVTPKLQRELTSYSMHSSTDELVFYKLDYDIYQRISPPDRKNLSVLLKIFRPHKFTDMNPK